MKRNTTESSQKPHVRFSLLLASYMCMVRLSQLATNIDVSLKFMTYPDFLVSSKHLFCSGSHSGHLAAFSCLVSWCSFWLWKRLQTAARLWWPWQLWGVLVRYVLRCPSTGICLMFSPVYTGVMGFGRSHRPKRPSSHPWRACEISMTSLSRP